MSTGTLVGRITDSFGRRYFFVGGSFLGLIGCIVCSRAQNVPTLVGGYVLVGSGESDVATRLCSFSNKHLPSPAMAAQGSFAFVIGELVPIKYRFIANAGLYFMSSPFCMLGAKVGTVITYNPSLGWRWIFYIMIVFNAASTLCWYLFYRPPTFAMLHGGSKSKRTMFFSFDYIGFVLVC